LQLLDEDGALQTQLHTTNPIGIEPMLEFARSKGFIFSADDLQAALDGYRGADVIRKRLAGDPQDAIFEG
jgi:hypothetical protein